LILTTLSSPPSLLPLCVCSGSISLEELRELLLDDSVLISKKTEHVNPKLVKLKSRSSLDTFQKLIAKEILIDAAADALMKDEDDIETGAGAGGKSVTGGHGKNEQKMDSDSLEIQSMSPANSTLSSSKKNYLVSAVKIAPENDEKITGSGAEKEGKDSNV
jgi:hypothetical protein